MNRGAEIFREATGTQGQKAQRLTLAQPYVSQLCNGKRTPGDELKGRLRDMYGVPVEAWDQPPIGDREPSSEQRRTVAGGAVPEVVAPAGKHPELPGPQIPDGPIVEQARGLLKWMLAKKSLTTEQANLVRELRQAMTLEAKHDLPLEEHPDFGPWVDGLLKALASVPGAFERLDAYLGAGAKAPRRAA